MVTFFENNDDCPTCEQHIDEVLKKKCYLQKQLCKRIQTGLHKLQDELNNRIVDLLRLQISQRQ